MMLAIIVAVIVLSFMLGFMDLGADEAFGVPDAKTKDEENYSLGEKAMYGLLYSMMAFVKGFVMLLVASLLLGFGYVLFLGASWLYQNGLGGLVDLIWNGAK